MKLFDLHCDTLYEAEKRRTDIRKSGCSLDITAEKTCGYERYVQVTAIWSENTLAPEEQWKRFFEICGYSLCRLPAGFENILSVEGGGLLCGRIERLDILRERGVRILTPMWAGENCLGGAHDTRAGLTDFGKETVRRCFETGIVPDISHASDMSAEDILEIAGELKKPVIASHSLSRTVHPHTRNLTDALFRAVAESGGIVGISLEPTHLGGDNAGAVIRHLKHFMSLGGGDCVCLGCDFDGTTAHLSDIDGADKLPVLYDRIGAEGIDPDRIFWKNAYDFAKRNNLID